MPQIETGTIRPGSKDSDFKMWRNRQGCQILDALSLNIVRELTSRKIRRVKSEIVMRRCIERIIKIFGKTVLVWPKSPHMLRKHRKDHIKVDKLAMSYSEISRKWNISERRIRVIISEPSDHNMISYSQSIVDLENIVVTEIISSNILAKSLVGELVRQILATTHKDIRYKSSAYLGDYTISQHEHLRHRIESMSTRSVEEIAMILGKSETEICRLQKQYKTREATYKPRELGQKIIFRKKRIMKYICQHKSADVYSFMEYLQTDITTARVALNELVAENLLTKKLIKESRSRKLIYSLCIEE